MTEEPLFSRAQLVAISGAPDDAVAFWLRNGLLRSIDRGERKHRRFTRDEVKIAVLLREARSIGLNLGAMMQIFGQLRTALAELDPYREQVGHMHDLVSYARDFADGYDRYVGSLAGLYPFHWIDDEALRDELVSVAKSIDVAKADLLRVATDFVTDSLRLVCTRRGDSWSVVNNVDLDTNQPLGFTSVIVFEGHTLLKLDWPDGYAGFYA